MPGQASWGTGRKLAAGAAAAVIIGSISPWASVTTFFGTISVAGTEGDGVITLLLAVVVGVMALLTSRAAHIVGIVAASAVVVVFAIDASDISSAVADDAPIRASVGWGLWLVGIGGVAAIVGLSLELASRRSTPEVRAVSYSPPPPSLPPPPPPTSPGQSPPPAP